MFQCSVFVYWQSSKLTQFVATLILLMYAMNYERQMADWCCCYISSWWQMHAEIHSWQNGRTVFLKSRLLHRRSRPHIRRLHSQRHRVLYSFLVFSDWGICAKCKHKRSLFVLAYLLSLLAIKWPLGCWKDILCMDSVDYCYYCSYKYMYACKVT